MTSENEIFSVAWELKNFGLSGKQKEIIYLNKFESQSLTSSCSKCDAFVRVQPSRSENDLCVKVTKADDERFLTINVPHYVGNVVQELAIVDICGLLVYKRKFPPKTSRLVDNLPVESYVGNSSTLVIRYSRQRTSDLGELSKRFCADGDTLFEPNESAPPDEDDGEAEGSGKGDTKVECDEDEDDKRVLPHPVFPVTFVFNNSEDRLLACKARLALKSSVFATMFGYNQRKSLEGLTNEVRITDSDFTTYKRFLQYVHYDKEVYLKTTGESLKECADKILPLANKYWISDLAEKCAVILVDNLTEHSAFNVIELLQMHYSGTMKQHCLNKTLDFIKEHPGIMKNAGKWNDLAKKYPELLRQVIINCLVKKSQDEK